MDILDFDRNITRNAGYLIRRAHQVADSVFASEMKDLRLTPVQYGILVAVFRHPGIDQYQLGRFIGFDRTTISLVVRKMKEKGLLETAKDANDRRSNLLSLTREGRQLLDTARPRAARSMDTLLGRIPEADQEKLIAILRDLVHAHDAQGLAPNVTRGQRGTGGD